MDYLFSKFQAIEKRISRQYSSRVGPGQSAWYPSQIPTKLFSFVAPEDI